MNEIFTEDFHRWFSLILYAFGPIIFIIGYKILKKKQHSTRHHIQIASEESDFAPAIIDREALLKAEFEASQTPLDYREKLLEEHSLLEKYNSIHGYTHEYMDSLTEALQAEGISAHYYFQETLPHGAYSLTRPHGVFELYVTRGLEEEARMIIAKWLRDKK